MKKRITPRNANLGQALKELRGQNVVDPKQKKVSYTPEFAKPKFVKAGSADRFMKSKRKT